MSIKLELLTGTVAKALHPFFAAQSVADALAALGVDAAGTAATLATAAQAAAIAASQPLDSDLTAIAALSTTSFGRAFLALANAAAARTAIGATIAQLETDAAITPAADNTYASPTSITIKKGIITAIS